MNTFRWITLCFLLTILSGCATSIKVKEHHLKADRSDYYPLAVLSAQSKPLQTGQAVGKYKNHLIGTRACGDTALAEGPIVAAIVCLPLIAFDIATGVVTANKQQNLEEEFERKTNLLRSKLIDVANQNKVRTKTMEYLHRRGANAHDVNPETQPADTADFYNSLKDAGYPMVLVMDLLSLDFSERKNSAGMLFYCLTAHVQGTTISTENSEQVATHKAQTSTCKEDLDKWLQEGEMESDSSSMYAAASSLVLDEILFLYRDFAIDKKESVSPGISFYGLLPLSPALEFGPEIYWLSDGNENSANNVGNEKQPDPNAEPSPDRVLDTYYRKPEFRKDYSPYGTRIAFTEVGIQPQFEWARLSGPNISDVRYDFRIIKGYEHVQLNAKIPFHGGRPIIFRHIRLHKDIYTKYDLMQNSHKPNVALEPCDWYFWSVRAHFKLYGQPRSTIWSHAQDGTWSGAQIPPPIRTKDSEGGSSCWEQAVNNDPM